MKKILFMALLLVTQGSKAQELYVFTEPASNMAAKSIALRLNNYLSHVNYSPQINYLLVPEVMLGVSKKVMVHTDVFFSNGNRELRAEGGSIYGKYRFLSHDDVQTHFRMAAFGRFSFNNSNISQQEINPYGYNSGFETGIVATQLLHKVALSSGLSFLKAIDNGSNKYPFGPKDSKAVNYTLSAGKLMLPEDYKNYRQTNVNLMLELLNQLNMGSGKYYIDAAPSVQFIFNSQGRIDLGYRRQLSGTLSRTAPDVFFIRLEYNFFNAY